MNIQQIEYALLLRKYGSFSRAAQKGGLTQSAVSQQITKLETGLGFRIFDRQTKPIKPTTAGYKFLEKAQMVMLEVQQLREFAEQLEEETEGALTIGIIPTLSPYLVPFFINELNEKYPKIKLTIREMMTKDIVRGILDRELHGGIISTPITTDLNFDFEPLFYEKFYLYASYKHQLYKKKQIKIEDISHDDLWLLNEGNCFSDQVNNMCAFGSRNKQKPALEYQSNSIDALRRIVEHKGGLTFLPELATLNVSESEEDMIKKLEGKPRAREISLIYTKGETKLPLLQKMTAIIKDSLPKSVLKKDEKILVKTNVEV